jgi:cytochrome c biogenesis protein
MVERIFRLFSSLKLTLANLFAILLAMAAGTLVNPGNAPLAEIEKAFASRPFALWSYRWFELYDLFHSWWFTLLLLSLALNLIARSLEKLPEIHLQSKYPEKRLDRTRGLRLRASGAPASDLASELRRRGYAVEVSAREGGSDVFAERGRNSRYGVWVVHLSLLVILAGGIAGRLTAFEGTALVPQNGGEVQSFTLRTPDGFALRKRLGFTLRCTDFRLNQFERGAPKTYESDLVVLDDQDRELKRATIDVNHPLQFGGLTILQSSYQPLEEGARARLRIVDNASGTGREVLLAAADKIEAAQGLTYSVVDYRQDLAGQGEAVQVLREEEGRRPARFWAFTKAPEGFDARNRPDRFAVSFRGTAPLYATGLQIARDPSTPVVYLGCFLLFVGCGILFHTVHKRVWARVTRAGVELGGASQRNADAFRLEFESICSAVGLEVASAAPALAA